MPQGVQVQVLSSVPYAGLAESADALLSKSSVERRMSANLISSTNKDNISLNFLDITNWRTDRPSIHLKMININSGQFS